MRIWYPNGRYVTLGLDPFSQWVIEFDRRYEEANANEPPKTRFEIWEGRISITATLIIWPREIYLYFATHTGAFTASWQTWALAIPLSIIILAAWCRFTRRWRSDRARKEHWKEHWANEDRLRELGE